MVADLTITTSLSAALADLIEPGSRLFNLYSVNALRGELTAHFYKRIPKHFELGARGHYMYERRRLATERKKRNFWKVPGSLDLVRSGATKASIKSGFQITKTGSAGNNSLEGRLNMWLPHPLKSALGGGIAPETIADEITAVTDAEAQEIGRGYVYRLSQQINAYSGPMRFLRKTKGGDKGIVSNSPRLTPKSFQPIGAKPSVMPHGPGF